MVSFIVVQCTISTAVHSSLECEPCRTYRKGEGISAKLQTVESSLASLSRKNKQDIHRRFRGSHTVRNRARENC